MKNRTIITVRKPLDERVVRLEQELRELAVVAFEDEQTDAVSADLAHAGLL